MKKEKQVGKPIRLRHSPSVTRCRNAFRVIVDVMDVTEILDGLSNKLIWARTHHTLFSPDSRVGRTRMSDTRSRQSIVAYRSRIYLFRTGSKGRLFSTDSRRGVVRCYARLRDDKFRRKSFEERVGNVFAYVTRPWGVETRFA